MNQKIKDDWQLVKLSEVATIERSSVLPEKIKSGTRYIGLEDIDSAGFIITNHLVEKGDLASAKFEFTDKHVLFGKLRPYLSKIALPSFDGICSTDILPILPKTEINRMYLYYFLRHPKIVQLATSRSTGANLPRLSPKVLGSFQIPLPSLEEQLEIVSKLNSANAVIAKRKEAMQLLDNYIESAFFEMFGDPIANPKKWKKLCVKDFAQVKIGPFGSLLHKQDYVRNGIPLINPKHISNKKIYVDKEKCITPEKMKELEQYRLKEGDIILGRRGEIGRCGLITEQEDGFLCGTGSMFIRPSKEVDSLFLVYLISSAQVSRQLENMAVGITMKNLNASIVKKLELPIPPLEKQKQFLAIVIQKDELMQKMTEQLSELDNQLHSLMERVLSRATAKKVVHKEAPKKTARDWFRINQVIGVVIKTLSNVGSPRGEMVIAKYMYLLQEIFGIPTQICFEKNRFGPYTNEIKKSLFAGASPTNKFFQRSGSGEQQVFLLGKNASKLLDGKYNTEILSSAETHMNWLAQTIGKLESSKVELLATVCKIIQDDQVSDLQSIKNKMEEWKPGKYTDVQLEKVLAFIKKQGWDSKLLELN